MLRLSCPTDPRYVDVALADAASLDRLLVDHAHCEHKAAVTALSFVSKYPDDPRLVLALSELARDEAGHFARVAALCIARGLSLGHPEQDRYVADLLRAVRPGVVEQRVDRLLCCALIEGRSCERLQLLAQALAAPGAPAGSSEIAALYDQLWREEAGHHTLFLELAERSHARAGGGGGIEERFRELAAHEARVVQALPLRPAIH